MAKKRKAKRGDIVRVEWIDSCSPNEGWHDPAILDELEPDTCVSIGELGRYDKIALTLAGARSTDRVADVTVIPASCVRDVAILRKAR